MSNSVQTDLPRSSLRLDSDIYTFRGSEFQKRMLPDILIMAMASRVRRTKKRLLLNPHTCDIEFGANKSTIQIPVDDVSGGHQ